MYFEAAFQALKRGLFQDRAFETLYEEYNCQTDNCLKIGLTLYCNEGTATGEASFSQIRVIQAINPEQATVFNFWKNYGVSEENCNEAIKGLKNRFYNDWDEFKQKYAPTFQKVTVDIESIPSIDSSDLMTKGLYLFGAAACAYIAWKCYQNYRRRNSV